MIIKELKEEHPRIYEKALQYQVVQGNSKNDTLEVNRNKRDGNFQWAETVEGFEFWDAITRKDFQVFYDKYPEAKTESKSTELTSLPEKWIILWKDREIFKITTKFFRRSLSYYPNSGLYFDARTQVNYHSYKAKLPSGYTEITFDQFKKWVLKGDVKSDTGGFIVDKWYQLTDLTKEYRKYNKLGLKDEIWYSEKIADGKYLKEAGKCSNLKRLKEASQEEIQQYLPEGHLDKVVVEENLVGRYLKALVAAPQGTSLKRGEYDKLIKKSSKNQYGTVKDWIYTTDNETACQWEVMPVGFNPSIVKPEEKVETWIPKVGEYFYCHTDLIMDGHGKTEANQGKVYLIEQRNCFTNNSGNTNHGMLGWSKWFRKALPHEIPSEDKPKDSMIELLKEAARRYPIGTEYIPLGSDGLARGDKTHIRYIAKECGDDHIEVGWGYVYVKGKWAEIVSTPSTTIAPSEYAKYAKASIASWQRMHDHMTAGLDPYLPEKSTTETMLPVVLKKRNKKSKLITINKK